MASAPTAQEQTVAQEGGLALRRCPTCGDEFPAAFRVCPMDSTPLGVDAEREDPLVGLLLAGTYRLARRLGRGGMGTLYEAEHVRLDRRFAVKVLHEVHSRARDAVLRFDREARSLSRIHSEHVLSVVDVLRVPDDRAALVTELLEGEDLKARLERVGKLTVGEAVSVARQVCRGLAAAHAEGVIHRDLKPSNLFLLAGPDGRLRVKVLDFGVAKIADEPELTRTGAVVGTPAYMAPEQALGSAGVDVRADIYAVGAVLYRALTGRAPYTGRDAARMLAKLLKEEPRRPRALDASIPVGLEAVVQRAMARDPDLRPDSALALEAELAAFDVGGGAEASVRWTGADPEGGTLVLPPGAVVDAALITRRARQARPLAVLAGAGVLAVTGGAASLAVVGLQTWTEATRSSGQEQAAWVVTASAVVAAGFALYKTLVGRWDSAPEVRRWVRRVTAGLAGATLALGALELAVRSLDALTEASDPLSGSALLTRAVAVAMGGVLGAGLSWASRPLPASAAAKPAKRRSGKSTRRAAPPRKRSARPRPA